MKHLFEHEVNAMIGLEIFFDEYGISPEPYRQYIEKIWRIIEEMREQIRKDTN